jgi:DMSO/TMAO reductase YedYZ molybdopterin-dependent catalytic subunit
VVSGLLAGAVAVAVGQLVAGITAPEGSPVVAVGQLQIDHTPPWLKNFAIREFGSHDKTVLLAGILVVLAGLSAAAGVLAMRRILLGFAALGVLAAVGFYAVATRPTDVSFAPTIAAVAAGAAALWMLANVARGRTTGPAPQSAPGRVGDHGGWDRRQFLLASASAAGVAVAGGLSGRLLADRLSVAGARAALHLPAPALPAGVLPADVDLGIPGLSRFVTTNGAFYRVDTALVVPQVPPTHWRLRIHGMVDRPVTVSLDDLLRRPLIEDYITVCCVSNPVGGPYIGNAKWLGASLPSLLRQAGIQSGADQLLCTSIDGFTSGTPLETVMDGRDALLAVAMNGQALPVEHGFPVRMVVPGLYGYVSATKWVTDIEVTTFARANAYWSQRGWSQQAPIKTESRIDVPGNQSHIPLLPATVAGVAWAQHKGVDAVEVRVDRGPWQVAHLAAVPGIDTWRQWAWQWDPIPGSHLIEARATDATGYTQTSQVSPPEPNGATGYPAITVHVSAR